MTELLSIEHCGGDAYDVVLNTGGQITRYRHRVIAGSIADIVQPPRALLPDQLDWNPAPLAAAVLAFHQARAHVLNCTSGANQAR